MCKEIKVRRLPRGVKFHGSYAYAEPFSLTWVTGSMEYAKTHVDEVAAESPIGMFGDEKPTTWGIRELVGVKMRMLTYVKTFLLSENIAFDEFNGRAPTRANLYVSYELTALWLWAEIVSAIKGESSEITDEWCRKYASVIASVMKKYPKITGILISFADLKLPGNKLLDYSKMENADFDDDHTDEGLNDEKAESFKKWIMTWTGRATEKDKMRVRNWFQTKKSHRQIFAEIQKVVGNYYKFNARLALFVEALFNKEDLEYFFSKSGFASKEDLFMAYFEKLTDFDDETKKSFIKKYLLG